MSVTALNILIILIPALPLFGFFIHLVFKDKISEKIAGIHASLWLVISFILSCVLFFQLGNTSITLNLGTWFSAGSLSIPYSFLIDQLSIIMMLVITGVGSLIHIYSIGYMHGDEGFNRFFSYLNLFIFFMLTLVMANNYVLMFVGWEGVGLCSYLLIGFWFKNESYNNAAKKAFIMNRIGDLALLLGLFLMFQHFGSLNYEAVFLNAQTWVPDTPTITLITILLFIGATGKSAQLPLYTWLPDAMAGPTPVSALIHAATMVTAGIYLIVRSNVLFILAPITMDVIMVVGLVTFIFAGTIGLKQNDIKKILAYSTVSQLGLMFFALGLGAFTAGFFHLITHAFFKALLFLAAGSVIHGLSGEQDIRKMGGLKSKMKLTHAVFLIGTITIAALPPFAGFFSKDAILIAAFEQHPLLWVLGLGASLMTIFYMCRLYFVVFYGTPRMSEKVEKHIHESPKTMTIPLLILASLSVIAGVLNLPSLVGGNAALNHYLEPLVETHHAHVEALTEWILIIGALAIMTLVILYARNKYVINEAVPESDQDMNKLSKIIANKYYVDELYAQIISKPFKALATTCNQFFETGIDQFVTGSTKVVTYFASQLKTIQTGYTSYYLFIMAIGVIAMLLFKMVL